MKNTEATEQTKNVWNYIEWLYQSGRFTLEEHDTLADLISHEIYSSHYSSEED